MAKSKGTDLVCAPNGRDETDIVDTRDTRLADYEFTRDLILGEGQGIVGAEFLGFGSPAVVADPATGESREVRTILLSLRGQRYRILASAMLERLFADIQPGSVVAVVNRGQVDTRRGRRMTYWDVGVRRNG